MKHKSKSFFFTVLLICTYFSLVHSQSKVEQNQIKVITDFYSAINAVCTDNHKNQHIAKLRSDSVIAKYCSRKIWQEAMQWLNKKNNNVSDLLHIDSESLKTLTVKTDTISPNTFHVSYSYNKSTLQDEIEKQKVNLIVTLKKEGKVFKIDDVR